MQDNHRVKLKRVLGFAPAYGAAVGLVVSGTAMFSVGNVAGTSGYATFITAIIALIPMMAAAFAFGELTAMLPGGGMISDYTQPALGKFFSTFALLSGYLVLISTDGAMQLVMGGVSLESLCGVPQIAVTAVMFLIVMVINMVNVDFYGKIESVVTIAMMIVFAAFAVLCNFRIGESFGAVPVNEGAPFLPEGNWMIVFSAVGSAIWFFIGFEFACPMAEENKKPYKNIPYALVIGLLTICLVDSLFALAAVRYTDMQVLRESTIPQIEASRAMLGKPGYLIMAVLTVLASFTTANAYMASLPRMLYGLAREGMVPKFFGKINKKTRTPINGILFTAGLMLITVIYLTISGTGVDVVQQLINIASITWMISYAIAMIDVLVLRKRYPDFPRLWKAPCAYVTMPIGLLGVVYAIFTLRAYLWQAAICMAIVAAYCLVWGKVKGFPLFKPTDIRESVASIQEHSEPLEVWDEEIDKYCKAHKV